MASHRQRTKGRTRAWQFGALALVAGGAAIAVMPLAKQLGPRPMVVAKPTEIGPDQEGTSGRGLGADDASILAALMNRIAGTVEVVHRDPVEPTEEVVVEMAVEEPPPPPPSEWAYKAYLASPTMKSAMVMVNEQQMLVSEGGIYEETKVLEVRPDHLVVEEDGAQRTITLARRVSNGFPTDGPRRPAVAIRGGVPGGQPGQPGAGQNNGFNLGQNTAAMAEQQRRNRLAVSPPPIPQNGDGQDGAMAEKLREMITSMPEERRDMMLKSISDQSMDPAKRVSLLRELGMPVGLSVEDQHQYLNQLGVSQDSDPRLYEQIKIQGSGK